MKATLADLKQKWETFLSEQLEQKRLEDLEALVSDKLLAEKAEQEVEEYFSNGDEAEL